MTSNRKSGRVALPEAGEGAYLQFTFEAFECLQTAYHDTKNQDYLSTITGKLSMMEIATYRTVLAAVLKGGDAADAPWELSLDDLYNRILDALNLAVHGKTYAEQKAIEDERVKARLQGVAENPQMAALLKAISLMNAGAEESEPASPLQNSAASPLTT